MDLKVFFEAINSIFNFVLFIRYEILLSILFQRIKTSKCCFALAKSFSKKEFAKDLKLIYQAPTKEIAEEELFKLDNKWGKKYPIVINSWQNKWDKLFSIF